MSTVTRACFLFGLLLLQMPLSIRGQEDDPCEHEPTAKAAKLIERGTDKRKYDADKRRGYLEDALEEDDQALQAAFALGLLAHTQARRTGEGFGEARTLLMSVHK